MGLAEVYTQWWATVVTQAAKFDNEENAHNKWLFETSLESWKKARDWSRSNSFDYPPPPVPSPKVRRTVTPDGAFYTQTTTYGPDLVAEPYVDPPPPPPPPLGVVVIAGKRDAGGFWAEQWDTVAEGRVVEIEGKKYARRVRVTPFVRLGYYEAE